MQGKLNARRGECSSPTLTETPPSCPPPAGRHSTSLSLEGGPNAAARLIGRNPRGQSPWPIARRRGRPRLAGSIRLAGGGQRETRS